MKQMKLHIIILLSLISLLLGFGAVAIHAGNTGLNYDCSQYAYGENVGWFNFKPTFGPGVTITDTEVTGYAWAENIGWINLSPFYGGVVNDGEGNLSGYAWGENMGWISFSCENTDSCNTVKYGVKVNPITGDFNGKAWGENIGWITFCSIGGRAMPWLMLLLLLDD